MVGMGPVLSAGSHYTLRLNPLRRLATVKPLHCILLAGPTASGKSAVALHLAQRLGGEIVSVDSMQVYRLLDIGTAKPSSSERELVPHHLVDVVGLTESFDAAQFLKLANAAVDQILSRGRVPILCGGTGFYFNVFLEGLGEAPPSDPALRELIEKTPLTELLCELKTRDPVTFEQIDRQNPRRVIRAIEVIRLTSKPFSEQRANWKGAAEISGPNHNPRQKRMRFFGLERRRDDSERRIEERVDKMFKLGLVAETERLLELGLASNRTALQAIGYRQTVEYLRGERSLADTIALVKLRTRQFAKRQMTWFRHQVEPEWLQLTAEDKEEAVAERLIKKLCNPGDGKSDNA